MNALLYLVSFFLLSTAGVFGFDLPGALLMEREPARSSVGAGYFVSVPDSLHARTMPAVPEEEQDVNFDGYHTHEPVRTLTPEPPSVTPKPTPTPSPAPTISSVPEAISAPPEIATNRVVEIGRSFTIQAIVDATNNERIRRGLPPMRIDFGLNAMAAAKVDDMIRYDYFDHVSPQGVDLAQLAEQVGYRYLLIGENLAYGNFTNPQAIVDAWMDSPGHRANILHTGYTHIGVSLRQARFRGIDAWVAVQEFSVPADACPQPDQSASVQIAASKGQLNAYQEELAVRDAQLSATAPSNPQYNSLVAEYNALVAEFRAQADMHNALVNAYNETVRVHRACVEVLF